MNKTSLNTLANSHISRCHKALRAIGAPLDGWFCDHIYDVFAKNEDSNYTICDLCGCNKVRFIHVMAHSSYHSTLEVGCICAGIMEGDMNAAKSREKNLKNEMLRRERFFDRDWKRASTGSYYLKQKGEYIFINPSRHTPNRYGVRINDKSVWLYKGKAIDSFKKATYAAFDLLKCKKRSQCHD